jgi:hypothetical protein
MQADLKWEPEQGSVGGNRPGTRGEELLYELYKLLGVSSTHRPCPSISRC